MENAVKFRFRGRLGTTCKCLPDTSPGTGSALSAAALRHSPAVHLRGWQLDFSERSRRIAVNDRYRGIGVQRLKIVVLPRSESSRKLVPGPGPDFRHMRPAAANSSATRTKARNFLAAAARPLRQRTVVERHTKITAEARIAEAGANVKGYQEIAS